ncbi:hypothetical protein GCM10008940_07380 [Microbulbifer agarilyticus]
MHAYFEGRAQPLSAQAELFGVSKTGLIRSYSNLSEAGLIRQPEVRPAGLGPWVNLQAAGEWLAYGIRYAEPAHKTGFGFGLPTAFNCPLVKTDMVAPEPPMCTAGASAQINVGEQEGILISPVDKHVTKAPRLSPGTYVLLATIDAIRIGKPRELMHARKFLTTLLSNAQTIQDRLHSEYQKYRAT